jgi:hypothetical protein
VVPLLGVMLNNVLIVLRLLLAVFDAFAVALYIVVVLIRCYHLGNHLSAAEPTWYVSVIGLYTGSFEISKVY